MAGPYKSLDDLDAAMSAKEQAKPYQSIGDLDAAISQSDANDQQRLGFSAKQSLTSNPEQYIKARDLGGQFGIPPDVAERNLPEVEYRNKLDALIGTMRSSPALGTLMQDPGYLKRTHDDIEALAQIEFEAKGFRAASEFQRKALDAEMQGIFDRVMTGAKIEAEIERNRPRTVLDYVGQGGSALASSLWSANSGLWGLGRAAADVAGTVLPDETAKELSGFFTRYQQSTGKTAQEMLGDPNQQGFVERSVYSGLQSLGQNLLTLPAALIPGVGAGVALGPMTAMTGGTEYGKARDKGVAIPQALIYGASQMAIEYATEVMPVTKFLSNIKAGTPFASMLMKQVAYEVPSEQVATLLQDLNEWAVINPAKPFAAYLEERPSAAAQTLIATIVGVGGQATTVKGVETLVGAFTGQEQAFADPMLRKANASQRSLDAEAKLTQLVDVTAQTASIARDPSAVKELIDAADEDGQTEIYINARQFANVFNQSPVETAAALGVTPEALNDALASNTDIVVPLSTFTTAVARDQALRPIIEHTRVDPGDMSPSEARLWQSQQGDQFKAEAEAVLAKRQADETFKAEVQQVHDNLLGQLNQAGRWAPQVNQKFAAMVRDFYVTMADRAGMTVSEMAAKYPLKVVAEGMGALQQGGAQSVADVMASWDTKGIENFISEKDGIITLSKIIVPKDQRSAGVGTAAMNELIAYADRTGQKIALTPSSDFGGNKKRLEKFYRGLGFRTYKGYAVREKLIRDPQQPAVPPAPTLQQPAYHDTPRASFDPSTNTIALLEGADLSSFLHESGHFFLEVMADLASRPDAPASIRKDFETALAWMGVAPTPELDAIGTWNLMSLDEKRPYHEKWARGYEAYLFEGRSPSVEMQGIFQRFSQWMKQVYTSLKALNVELTDDVRGVFDRMIASEDAIKTAEAVRNFAPIFQTAEQAGMTAEEWEQYQAEGRESTDTAVDELQARSIRDMRWQANAKAKKIKELQATAKELRAEVKIDVRREVLSQPLYRAWQFLTGKEVSQSALEYREAVNNYARQLAGWEKSREQKVKDVTTRAKQDVWEASEEGQVRYRKAESRVKAQAKVERRDAVQIQKRADEYMGQWESENPRPVEPTQSGKKTPEPKSDPNKVDPTKDTLLIAIAKLGGLDKLQAVEEWGLDPKEKIPQVAFGKPVVRKEGGRKLDAMAEALAQYGYLETDATGKWDNRQFEEMFFDALRGGEYFSQYGEEAMIAAATREAQGDPDAGITLENTPAGKLNTEMLKGMYGETDTAPWRLLSALRMTSPDGLAPDQVADLFGFTSGDDLVRRLAVAEDPKALIDQLTDQRMLELHGDLATPAEIELAAERAIHNDVRARVLTRELNALRKATGQGNVMLKAARMHAEQWLARQTVKNATRHAQHVAAEGRAARAVTESMKAGDLAAAAQHKLDQVLNNQLARGSIRAAEEVRRAVKYLKKFDKAGSRKAIDQDYLDQIDQLLERFDLRQVSGKALEKRASLAAWLKQQEELGLDPVIDAALVEEAQRQHYSTLTLEEFRGLVDSIQSIEHMGRLKNRLLTAKDKREFKAVKDELVANIIANANRSVTTTNPITPLEKGAKILRNFSAMHRKFASIIREMDGGQDGGKMWEYLVRTMNDAGDAEVEMRSAMSEKFADLFAGLKSIKLNEKVYIPALKISLRREELLAVALNSGNEGNVQRLLDGGINESLRAITYRQLFDVLNMVTPQEWDFVEGVWGMIEANRPAIAAQEKALTGVEPKWVEPTPFTLASGRVIRGGYYPAKYNADMSTRSNELEAVTDLRQQMMGAGGRAATRKSYTEARAAEVSGRPMRLDLGVIAQHINEVTHRLAWQEWLIDARRILHAPDIDRAIRDHYGPEILAQLKKQLVDIAAGDNGPTDAMDRVMAHLRNGTTIAGMGWNIMTSLMQPIGLTQSAERIGVTWLGKGLAEYMRGNPFKVTAEVHERSSFMANRAKTLNREINDVLNQIKSERMSQVEASYFYLIQKFQQMVDVPTWLGAYEKAIADGNADDRAVALADQAVIDSQGTGQLKDLAAIQRGSAGQKLFTAFYSFFSTTYNRAVENYRATDFRNPLQVGKLAANYLLLFTLPAVWGWALKEALRGDDDDEDAAKIAKRLAAEQLNYLLGTMVLVREIGGAISGFQGYQGPAGTRFFAELGKFIKQAQQGDVDMALVKAAANTVGVAAHLPSGQVIKSVDGTVAVMDGKAGPQAILVGPPLKN